MYTELNLSDLDIGKPIKKSLWTTLRDNGISHESRLDNIEQGAGKVVVANFALTGYISHYSASELVGIKNFLSPSSFNLLEFRITLLDTENSFTPAGAPIESSTAGVLSIDLLKSIDGGASFSTILTTKPSINDGQNGAGLSSADCTPTVFAGTSIDQGDHLMINVTSLKDQTGAFLITCYGSLD